MIHVETMHNFNGFSQFTITMIQCNERPSLEGAIYRGIVERDREREISPSLSLYIYNIYMF